MFSLRHIVLVSILTAGLAACESAEERAQGHFSSAEALIAEGDMARAKIELRNALQLDEDHREARRAFAEILRDEGREGDAFNQYRRLAEQYPGDLEVLRAVSEIAVARLDWNNAARFVPAAAELAPEDPAIGAMLAAVDYRAAMAARDTVAAEDAVARAHAFLDEDSTLLPAREVLIDARLRENDGERALAEVEEALRLAPDNLRYHEMKLQLLQALRQTEAVGAHLEEINRRFPANERIRQLLIGWYVSQDRLDPAEAFLREQIESADPQDRDDARVTVVQFLRQTRGEEAALDETSRLIEAAEGGAEARFRTLRAQILFESGDRDAGIAEIQRAIEAAPDGTEQRIAATLSLAQMLAGTGDEVGARARVEEVLAADSDNPGALRLRAAWQIEDDRPAEAIANLRIALEQEPRDSATLMLMAQAHLRDGARLLAGERLSLAVEASGQGARESLAYAEFLLQDDDQDLALRVLGDALSRAPANMDLLSAEAQIRMARTDWSRVRQIVASLRAIGSDEAVARANALQTQLLQSQNRFDESAGFLSDLIARGEVPRQAVALVIQDFLRSGDLAGAQSYLDDRLAEAPEDPGLVFLQAGLDAARGDLEVAEAGYRAILEDQPNADAASRALFLLLAQTGRMEAADAVLAEGIAASDPPSPELLKLRASRLERAGDTEGAIAIYEDLYARNSNDVVVANNLASLLSMTRAEDPEALDRAYAIARRLRAYEVPALQDTYGWIEHLRGNSQTAIEYLEPAAEGLPEDAVVQAHLGLAQAAAEQVEAARDTLTRALELAGDRQAPALDLARQTLSDLPAPAATE